ncbi:MAG: MerR family transcriptional regulator [Anaerolineaceae bacterium]|jgi:DNA-binding transcriptional MerR regulator|nr:MerR family transcriptional regulator [Anaerolineaceae bacterium]
MLTVKQISKLAHITPRTLRYYDQIGLLLPDFVGENGYRYYSDASLLKLQQILFYRELEIPLEQIKEIMGRQNFDLLTALEDHKRQLGKKIDRLNKLITTVDQTLKYIKGEEEMNKKVLFDAFNDEEQKEMEKEALQMYDPETVKESNRKWKSYSTAEKQKISDEGNAVYQGFVDAMSKGPDSQEAQACVQHWREHMNYFWVPNQEELLGLADLYNDDPRFKKNFDKVHPDLAQFVREAVQFYVSRLR